MLSSDEDILGQAETWVRAGKGVALAPATQVGAGWVGVALIGRAP